jgi:hypothetical protein
MKKNYLIFYSVIVCCLLVFIVVDELFLKSHDYLLETIIALCVLGPTVPLQLLAGCKSTKECGRIIKISSLVYLFSILSVILFLQLAQDKSIGWPFLKTVVIVLVLWAINLKASLMSIRNSGDKSQ